MAFRLNRHAEPGWLCYQVIGDASVLNLRALADTFREDCKALTCVSVLVDCGGIRGSLTLTESFEVAQYFANVIGPEIRIASFSMPDAWRGNRFSENVVNNRGGDLRHFPTREEAVAWLRSRATSSSIHSSATSG